MKQDPSADPEPVFLDPERPLSIRRVQQLTSKSREMLDELPIGVIQIDREGKVLMYNRAEARLAGKDAEDVLGKNFFTEVAPCTNVQRFAGRFRTELGPDKPLVMFPYDFVFSGKRVHVTILMHFDQDADCGWIFVQAGPTKRDPS